MIADCIRVKMINKIEKNLTTIFARKILNIETIVANIFPDRALGFIFNLGNLRSALSKLDSRYH
jgi:hypothetical protein